MMPLRKCQAITRLSFIVITLWTFHPAFSQLSTSDLKNYSEKDGLPGTMVNSILVDRLGYVWVGTINGLTRFDGYKFQRFYENPNDPGSIAGLVIWSLFEDSKGRIWIGAQPGKLNVYDPVKQTFKHYEYTDLVEFDPTVEIGISHINENANGIYFGVTSNFGQSISSCLFYLDEKEDKIKKLATEDGSPLLNVISMTRDKKDIIWTITYDGIYKVKGPHDITKVELAKNAHQPRLEGEFTTQVICAQDGYMWFITNYARLVKVHPETLVYEVYEPAGRLNNNSFNSIAQDGDGNIWVGTEYELFLFDTKNKTVKRFDNSKVNWGLGPVNARAITFDSFGAVWIGTQTNGLFKYEKRSFFKSYSNDAENPNTITGGWGNSILELNDGNVLITTSGTVNSGLNILNLQKNEISPIPYKKILPGVGAVSAAIEKSPGEYYLASFGQQYQFSYPSRSIKKISLPGLPESVIINHFKNDSHGYQWIFTNNGVYRRSGTTDTFEKLKPEVQSEDETSLRSVMRAVESKKHGLWLLTNDRLFLYDYSTNKIERIGSDKAKGDIFITQDVNSLYEDSTGTVWVGTWQGGLSRYDVETGKIKTYTVNDGLPSMSIQSILPDERNNTLWLSTFEGLSRFDMTNEQFYNYSIEDGIQSQLFADGSYLKTSKGLILFGGSNGVTVFNPADATIKSLPPKVFLTDLKLFNQSILPGKDSPLKKPIYETTDSHLTHDQNNITLEFIALHFSNPQKNRYAYKLENYDNDWRDVTNSLIAFYPNLPPGGYKFQLKAANSNGVWNEQGTFLNITISPPWWNTSWAYGIYAVMLIAGAFGADRYFRYRVLQKERARAQIKELEQAREIEKAYTKLKATQSQLIQSEKMASLGELTAGIAHEIQNPLNFVNNFSELNTELIEELRAESGKPKADQDDQLFDELLNTLKENEQKIVHHGKRADAIVKGMLQHSRSSSGQKELTDINALCDEYLRLAYHGLRAKDKSFNAKFVTNLDVALPKINVIPQDVGRVVLNLINNAFYAVNEKVKSETSNVKESSSHVSHFTSHYEPLVTVSTKNLGDKIQISVKDNGPGIPDTIKEKIFQPFFTTKPTGQGTGLGLSLSYDIVKAHGGELKVETRDAEGSVFILLLPTN